MQSLSRRQLIKQRKMNRLISHSENMELSFHIGTKDIIKFFENPINNSLDFFEFSLFNKFKVTLNYKGKVYKNIVNFINLVRNERLFDHERAAFYFAGGIELYNKKRALPVRQDFCYFSNNEISLIFRGDINVSYIGDIYLNRNRLNLVSVHQINGQKENLHLLLDKQVFKNKLVKLLKDILAYLKNKLIELDKNELIPEYDVDELYLMLCNQIYVEIYRDHIMTKEGFNKIVKTNKMFKTCITRIHEHMDYDTNALDNSSDEVIYSFTYNYRFIRSLRNSHNQSIIIGVFVTKKKFLADVRFIKLKNYLKDVFDLDEYKDDNGKLKNCYYFSLNNRFIQSINRGIL